MMRKRIFIGLSLIPLLTLIFLIPTAMADSADNRLLKVRQAIKAGGARWQAASNSISKLRPEVQRQLLGWIPSAQSELYTSDVPLLDETLYTAALPTRFDWRDVDGKNYISSVKRQRCGDCWAFAAIGAMEARLAIDGQPGEDLSEQLLVSDCCSSGSCNGGYIVATSRFIRDLGSPGEGCYPYLGRDSDCGQACGNWRNLALKMSSYTRVSQTVSALKSALYTRGPINVGMMVYSDFSSYSSGIYEYAYGQREGGHAVLIVGYDDNQECFIVKNSWGTGWGEGGFFRIAYSQVDNAVGFGAEACVYGDEIDHDDDPDPNPTPDSELDNGEVVNDLSGARGQWQYFTIAVPADADDLRIQIEGGSGDADLYVRRDAAPTLGSYDCRPYRWGNNELCAFAAPASGTYHIGLYGYEAYAGMDLNASYLEGGGDPGESVTRLGSWTAGTIHAAPDGGERVLIFTVHAEDDNTDLNALSATYGGQAMQKVVDRQVSTGYRAYVAAFLLDEAGIAAARDGQLQVQWNHAPYRTPGYASAFFGHVDQNRPVGPTAGATGTSATVATAEMVTHTGDRVLTAATCGNAGSYSVGNGFSEGLELAIPSADGVVGEKAATGAAERASVQHSRANRQAIIGMVLQAH